MIQEVYLIDNDDKIKDKLVKMFEKEEDYNYWGYTIIFIISNIIT